MILTEEINIKLNAQNIRHYIDLGYKCNPHDEICVKINDLSDGSNYKIRVKCDICGKEKELKYHFYLKNIKKYNYYSCSNKCSQEKVKKTNLERYGVEYPIQNSEIYEKIKKTNLERYGVEHLTQLEEIKEKIKKINLERYGVECPLRNSEIKEKTKKTNLERYGFEYSYQNEDIKNKYKKTMMNKYGVEYPIQNSEIKEKTKKTNLERYGVEYSAQNYEIFKKTQSSAFKLKNYKNLTYIGTYELDFLIKFSDNYKIEQAKTIDYIFENKNKKYFPDYYLPDYNLIVEIKSTYTYDYEKEQNESKKEATINNGYNFIFIIDKDYTEFLSIL